MKCVLAQINPIVGDFAGNYQKILSFYRKARQHDADIVVFPELALCGYPPEDLLLKSSFIQRNDFWLKKLQAQIHDVICVVGCTHPDPEGVTNAAAVLYDGKLIDVYHKIDLPNYGVFDEKRYFVPGKNVVVYTVRNKTVALSICEDVWTDTVVQGLQGKKVDMLINISSSPFYLGKWERRLEVLSRKAQMLGCTLLYCNTIGGQDELVFDGKSLVISPQGKMILKAKGFQEDFLVYDTEKEYPPLEEKTNTIDDAASALMLGLRDYVHKNGFQKVVIGISGGIDSAVTAVLAQKALGKNNVIGLIMPSRFTSEGTFNDAKVICQNLGIEHHSISIEGMMKSYLESLAPFFKGKKPDITEENIQARIRGNVLMAFSNKFGYLVLNTGNKSELSVGYCTLYGDMVGGFGLLKDVTKRTVYALADYLNRRSKKCIPVSVITRAPSAELRHGQKDEDSIPAYEVLDPILQLYIEKDYSYDQIVQEGYDPAVVKRIITLIDRNEYKRRQGPPGVKITPRAFGKDRRMPITNKFIL